jgi:hypothetical protein
MQRKEAFEILSPLICIKLHFTSIPHVKIDSQNSFRILALAAIPCNKIIQILNIPALPQIS